MFEISNITKYFASFCFSFSNSSQSNILYCPKFLTKNIHTASHSYCSCCFILLLFILLHTPTVHTASYSYCSYCLIFLLFILPHTPTVHAASYSYCSSCLMLLLFMLPHTPTVHTACTPTVHTACTLTELKQNLLHWPFSSPVLSSYWTSG